MIPWQVVAATSDYFTPVQAGSVCWEDATSPQSSSDPAQRALPLPAPGAGCAF